LHEFGGVLKTAMIHSKIRGISVWQEKKRKREKEIDEASHGARDHFSRLLLVQVSSTAILIFLAPQRPLPCIEEAVCPRRTVRIQGKFRVERVEAREEEGRVW
jgi:hypothetical protein